MIRPPARWWERDDNRLKCTLCPRYCTLSEGQAGFCFVRKNEGGQMVSLAWGTSTGFAVDPIEKKPLKHFLPGTGVLSFGTAGCNLGCKFCQNWSISKAKITQRQTLECTPEKVVALARKQGCPSIACTYNDPVIYAEFMDDIGKEARRQGLQTVAVTAGYVTESAREEVFRHVDAANVDLKAFTETFYRKLTLSSLKPVLDFLVWAKTHTNMWLEVTTLLIPDHNDSTYELEEQCRWMVDHLGAETPLHLTAFHPDFKLRDKPRTPRSTLERARDIARNAGLSYVYTGNVHDVTGQTTFCPGCDHAVIERDWHRILSYDLVDTNRCGRCRTEIAGVFEADHPFSNDPSSSYHGGRRDYLPFSKRIFRK